MDTNMIAILLIALGKYETFLEPLIKSINEKFMTNKEKKIIVFSDTKLTFGDNVIIIPAEKKGWPYDTMMRFDLFSEYKDLYMECSHVVYLDSDMLIVDNISDEILHNLFGVIHPGFFHKKGMGDFETNPLSTASITREDINEIYYHQGCFFGGSSSKFTELVEFCKYNQNKDFENNFIARWHDESHLNKYFSINIPHSLESGYAYPEKWNIPFKKRILHLLKNHDEIRK